MNSTPRNIETRLSAKREKRHRLFMTLVPTLTFLFLVLLGWNSWSLYSQIRASAEKRLTIEKLRGSIIYLDEVLTMSANMGALTGEPNWERRYLEYEPQLDAAIDATVDFAAKDSLDRSVTETDDANYKLVVMEKRVFDLVREARLNEARSILFGDEYALQKKKYARGMADLADSLSKAYADDVKNEQRKFYLSVTIIIVTILLLFMVWLVGFRAVWGWKRTLVSNTLLKKEIARSAAAEKRFKELTETLPLTIFEMDPEGKLIFVNLPGLAQFRLSQKDLMLGLNALDMLIPDDRDRALKLISIILETKETRSDEFIAQRKDGSTFPCIISAIPLLEKGQPVGLRGFVIDITERKNAEEALRESEERLWKLIEQSPITYELYDKNGIQRMVNPAYGRLWGIEPEATIGSFNIWQTSQGTDLHPYLKRAFKGESVVLPDMHWDSKKEIGLGRDRWISTIIYPIRKNHGDVNQIVILHEDITARMKVENTLNENEHRLKTLLGNLPGMAYQCYNEPRYPMLSVSPGCFPLTGYNPEDLLTGNPKCYGDIIHPDDLSRVWDAIQQAVDENHSFLLEYRIRSKDGKEKWVWEKGRTYSAASDTRKVLEGFIMDITSRKELQAQVQQAQKMEAIGLLAGGVAHEINNPVNGIMNYAQLIQDSRDRSNRIAEFAAAIICETQRVAGIVRNLLTFARQDRRHHSPARLKDIVEATLSLISTVIKHDQITLQVEVPADLPQINCLSQQIQQVLMNLVTNARDALNEKYPGFDEDKLIRLTAAVIEKRGRRFIRTTVEDHGCGIPETEMARIFEPFYTTKPKEIGTGLGLSISYGIVQDHGGELWFESLHRGGSLFHMDLPLNDE